MKLNYFFIIVFLFFSVRDNFAQRSVPGSWGMNKDSLILDGSNMEFRDISFEINDLCHGKITYQKGPVQYKTTGKVVVDRSVCMDTPHPDTVETFEFREKNPGDFIHSGDEVQTGADGIAEIEMSDGSTVRIGPNSHFTLDCSQDFEKQTESLKDVLGEIWSEVTDAVGNNQHEVETHRSTIGVRGTKFEIISTEEQTTIKLYEGKVTAKNRKYGHDTELTPDMQKKMKAELQDITNDVVSGKLIGDQIQLKIQEVYNKYKDSPDVHSVYLEPGQMTIVRGDDDPTTPTAITSENDPWYAPKNFGR